MFENKKIFILGMARSGYEAAKLLAKHNNEILITDMAEQEIEHLEELKKAKVTFIKTNEPEKLLDSSFDFVVKNPGIKINHPVCEKAKSLKISVTNEVEVAYSFFPKNVKIIAISGSNGKTTTTTIIYEILKKAGLPVYLGGNIGYPVCSLVYKVKMGDMVVLEISSHQLYDMENFKADIAILTNLSEVHIDHFGTYENYKKQKVKIFNNQTEENIAVINAGDTDSMEMTRDIFSKKMYFSSESEKTDAYIKDNAIWFRENKVIDLSKIKIKGNHNYENIMCAILTVKQFNVDNKYIEEVLKDFCGVEHRLEFVKNICGVDYYNDSKATNVKSTQIALSSFSTPIVLILGGLDRGHSFDDLEPYMKNVKEIACFGETKERIKGFADKVGIKCEVFDNLEQAVLHANKIAEPGDTVLLSPACASWDQYKKFEDRGNDFKKIVKGIY